ncbi:MAG TPA: amidohydrolase [Candidatus Acidoferrales bacterium]|nr:amidohydrolase [Candidatus Acidoferrales bacterium]
MRSCLLLLSAALALSAADDVLTRVAAHAGRFGAVSRQIWETPELGFHENRSSVLLQQELKANGFTVKPDLAGMPTAFTAEWGTGGPVIGIMGEFDALPGLSQKDVPALSPVVDGAPGHGCGHNLLGSASALAVVAIKEEMQARGLKGTIRYYGTPAEEGGGGKIYMIHAGLFKDVDAVLAWHPGDSNRVNLGSSLANNGGLFRFYGVASHAAAAPERGRSALDGVMIMLNAVEMLREHVPSQTRIHYIITNGGSAPNVVPAFAEVSLVARHPDAAVLDGIWQRIMKCAQAGALASETRMEFEQGTNYANALPNDVLADVLSRAMRKAGGYRYTPEEQNFAAELQKSLGEAGDRPSPETVTTDKSTPSGVASSDAGDVSWNVPTAQFTAATFVPGVSAHTWQAAACAGTTIGRNGMLVAARTLSLGAIELFENPGEVKAARAAFEKRLAGRKWTTRIAPDSKPRLNYATK